jgi:hypothetical protein
MRRRNGAMALSASARWTFCSTSRMVTPDALSDYAYVIAEGRPFCEGPSDTVATMPEIRQVYLGL